MSEDTGRASPKPPSVDRLSLLWRRINDHKMVQWSVAYIALAYGLQHGVILTSESFEWPNAVARISMLLLALGLPVVMTFAWYHGERASQQFTKAELSILSALLVIGSLLFYAFVQPSAEVVAGPRSAVQQASLTAARAAAASPAGAISVAVLPFANVTGDASQDFFSDGITDEISGALAKIADLRVVARTSAFQFKGQSRDIQAIGQQLHATHLIEGSVRKAGNRVRISAELVQADNGIQVWSENYDRDLTDVFAIQEDIAHAIAASLRMPLGLKPGENLVNSRTKDEATYEDYLRAKALVRARGLQQLTGATKLLEQVVARDPDFAPGWALLALGYALTPNADRVSGRPVIEAVLAKAEAAARRAIQLDPKNPDGYVTLGLIEHARGNQIGGRRCVGESHGPGPDQCGRASSLQRFSCGHGLRQTGASFAAAIAGS
jgi:TolB-like protein